MPRLVLRDIPDDVYEALSRSALMDSRSVVQQALALLRTALHMREEQSSRRKSVLKEIDGLHIKNINRLPDPTALIKEAREK